MEAKKQAKVEKIVARINDMFLRVDADMERLTDMGIAVEFNTVDSEPMKILSWQEKGST